MDTEAPEAARARLHEFAARYDYDVTYLERLLDLAPRAFAAFEAGMAMTRFRAALAPHAAAVAKIAVLRTDDCGPCLQLNLKLAVEAGVDRGLLATALEEPKRLPAHLRDVYDHARSVAAGENGDPDRIARLRAALGDAAFGELAVQVVGVRIYPAMKRALGAAVACERATLGF